MMTFEKFIGYYRKIIFKNHDIIDELIYNKISINKKEEKQKKDQIKNLFILKIMNFLKII